MPLRPKRYTVVGDQEVALVVLDSFLTCGQWWVKIIKINFIFIRVGAQRGGPGTVVPMKVLAFVHIFIYY